MRKLTPEQEAVKRQAKASYTAYTTAVANKQRAVEEFAAQYDADIEPLRLRWLADAVGTKAAKIPITHIARDILGHKGTVAAYQAIAEGERMSGVASEVDDQVRAAHSSISMQNGDLVYTPKPEELAPVIEKLGLEPIEAPASATFRVDDGRVVAVTSRILPAGGMHPVVALVLADGSKHARALIEFAEHNDSK